MESIKVNHKSEKTIKTLLQLIDALVTEVHPQRVSPESITLDSTFDKNLGLDSLTRVELIHRVERQFSLTLPERTFTEAETARDLLRILLGTETQKTSYSISEIRQIQTNGHLATPTQAQTLIDVLDWHVLHQADRPHIQLYQDDVNGETITYQQLKERANRVAGGLLERGLQAAEPVAIMLPSSPDYFYSFFGILTAGGIPVPMYPPARPSQLEDHIRRHVSILNNCQAHSLITVPEAKRVAQLLKSQVPGLKNITTVAELNTSTTIANPPALTANDIAFLQYTSGSTGDPKGVVLTHKNLLTNIRAMGHAVNATANDVFVSWLPLYHDMGLIGAWLGSLYYAALFVVMSPIHFIMRPERWLWAIHRYRGTLSASPNFGYEYCIKRLTTNDISNLDLSSWRAAFNGAEAVSPDTIERFTAHFSKCGFQAKAMMPVYGLAESSVGLAFPPLNRGAVFDRIERESFMRTAQAISAPDTDPHALRFVSSGLPLLGHQIRIVDQAGHELPERQAGRLQFTGPSCTSGYFRNAEKNRNLFDKGWLESGDIAYISHGEVYITGRSKDIIIHAGRNIYPHELEEAIGKLPGIRTGRVAIFGSEDKKTKTERLVVLAETRVTKHVERDKLQNEINALAVDLTGAPPDDVVLAPANTVLKTSSGKIRRTASREIYEKGEIGQARKNLSWQIARLTLSSIKPQLHRLSQYLKALSFAAYSWFVFGLLAPIVWLTAVLSPNFAIRWKVMKKCIHLLAKATATPLKVDGLEHLPEPGQPYVLVANHASYLDSYALVGLLPNTFCFVAKAELAKSFITRQPLKNIQTVFVERFDIKQSTQEVQHLVQLLKSGQPLMFFAEGTFSRIPGLMPFHLGAFVVAAAANASVIPVAIRGTRSLLRSESWFPHRGSVSIEIGQAIDPKAIVDETHDDTWHTAIGLRDRSREFILRHCREPDLAQQAVHKPESNE